MSNLFIIGLLVAQIAIIAGLIKPAWVKTTSRKKVLGIYGIALVVCFVGFGMTYDKTSQAVSAKQDDKKMQQVAQKQPKQVKEQPKAIPQEKVEIDMDEVNKRYDKYLQQTAQKTSAKPTYSDDPAVRKLQDWVGRYITTGKAFDHNGLYDKLGSYELIKITRGNPSILKAFYYPNADITIIANVKTRKVVTWRLGRQSS